MFFVKRIAIPLLASLLAIAPAFAAEWRLSGKVVDAEEGIHVLAISDRAHLRAPVMGVLRQVGALAGHALGRR